MNAPADLFLGLDIGPCGARAALVDTRGTLLADAFCPIPPGSVWRGGNGEHEQDPLGWWIASRNAIDRCLAVAKGSGREPEAVRALAVSSPSGALAFLDAGGMPVGRALMPDDPRGNDHIGELNRAGEGFVAKLGHRFHVSFGLARLAYLHARDPARFERATRILHAADTVAARLTGRSDVTDWTHALKTGFDPVEGAWAPFLSEALQLPVDKLPRPVRPGEAIGRAEGPGAREAGLAPGTLVVAGMTEECASQVGVGAVSPGASGSSLGPALALKAASKDLVRDPKGRVLSCRLADDLWLAVGVSRAGLAALDREFGRTRLPLLDERVGSHLPTRGLVYPLPGKGERFPFVRHEMETWWIEEVEDKTERYGAMLEGSAYVERLGYEVLRGLDLSIDGPVRTNGDGTRSAPWLKVRASALNRPLEVTAHGSAAFGMAVTAAAKAAYPGLPEAVAAMVRVRTRVEPHPEWVGAYEERFRRFVAALKERGYIA